MSEAVGQPTSTAPEGCHLRLYIAGQSPKSLRAVANLNRICQEQLDSAYSIEIVDLLESPRLASADQILAIPTLVRRSPKPVRKVIGDLSDAGKVIAALDLYPTAT